MPRLLIATDDRQVVLDEALPLVVLNDEHAASQVLERMVWALEDAEKAEKPQGTLSGV